jgi:hypothetical protein
MTTDIVEKDPIVRDSVVITKELQLVTSFAKGIVVKDSASYAEAGEAVKKITRLMNEGLEEFTKRKREVDAVKNRILSDEKSWVALWKPTKDALVMNAQSWEDEQRRIQREAKAKAEAEARRIAEEEA